jgi:adenine-specific DNA-methyltransferase
MSLSTLPTVPTVPTVPYHKKYAQYFTTNPILKEKVFSFLLNLPKCQLERSGGDYPSNYVGNMVKDLTSSFLPNLLEPSIGRGDLVTYIQERIPNATFDMYEIDNTIDFLATINREKIHFGDFLSAPFPSDKKYKTIVANPPFLSTPNSKKNIYISFIEKCFDLLAELGEMVFIIPSEFFHLTSALPILKRIMAVGTFTHIYHPGNERMFEGACIDVLVFRYVKSGGGEAGARDVLYNDEPRKIVFDSCFRFLSLSEAPAFGPSALVPSALVSDSFDIFVGMVSAKDEVFKHTDLGNISVITGENRQEKFIFLETFPSSDPRIDAYLETKKPDLLARKIRKFHDRNWFEWGAPRNITTIRRFWGQPCIYVATLTRETRVAFLGKVAYFGGGLLMLVPKNSDKKSISPRFLESVVAHFNSPEFQTNYRFSGRFKMGQRMLSDAIIPL